MRLVSARIHVASGRFAGSRARARARGTRGTDPTTTRDPMASSSAEGMYAREDARRKTETLAVGTRSAAFQLFRQTSRTRARVTYAHSRFLIVRMPVETSRTTNTDDGRPTRGLRYAWGAKRAHVVTDARGQWAVREVATSQIALAARLHARPRRPIAATGSSQSPGRRSAGAYAGTLRRTPTLLKRAKPRVPPTFSSLSLPPTFHLAFTDRPRAVGPRVVCARLARVALRDR